MAKPSRVHHQTASPRTQGLATALALWVASVGRADTGLLLRTCNQVGSWEERVMTGSTSQQETGLAGAQESLNWPPGTLQSPVQPGGQESQGPPASPLRRDKTREAAELLQATLCAAPEEGAHPTPVQQWQVWGPQFWAERDKTCWVPTPVTRVSPAPR